MNYDQDFVSGYDALVSFEKKGKEDFYVSIKQSEELLYVYPTRIDPSNKENYFYLKKLVLILFWMVGGYQVILTGSKDAFDEFVSHAKEDSEIQTSLDYMSKVFHQKAEILYSPVKPIEKKKTIQIQDNFKGCRIGFDAGGSDRKVSAVIDGKVVFSKETLWNPKENTDWKYHRDGILQSLKEAASYLPRIDAIGVSTAGVVVNEEIAQANLFMNVPQADQDKHCRTIYQEIVKENFPGVPLFVANDGDVSAFGGAFAFHKDYILGLAFGTSLAAGYCEKKSFNGFISEFGKVPFDFSLNAPCHYATKIQGSGAMLLSQKGVLSLAAKAGYSYSGSLAEQLKEVQKEAERNNPDILKAYEDMGEYLACAISLYCKFLHIENVLLLGRVMSGKGGEVMKKKAEEILLSSGKKVLLLMPDENFRRLGQSYMAAGLAK